MSEDDRHFLEVGSAERPERTPDGAPERAEAASAPASAGFRARGAGAAPAPVRDDRAGGFDPCATFAAIDYRGDRAPSDFRCAGERISNLFWQTLMLVGIIAGSLLLFSTCPAGRIPAG